MMDASSSIPTRLPEDNNDQSTHNEPPRPLQERLIRTRAQNRQSTSRPLAILRRPTSNLPSILTSPSALQRLSSSPQQVGTKNTGKNVIASDESCTHDLQVKKYVNNNGAQQNLASNDKFHPNFPLDDQEPASSRHHSPEKINSVESTEGERFSMNSSITRRKKDKLNRQKDVYRLQIYRKGPTSQWRTIELIADKICSDYRKRYRGDFKKELAKFQKHLRLEMYNYMTHLADIRGLNHALKHALHETTRCRQEMLGVKRERSRLSEDIARMESEISSMQTQLKNSRHADAFLKRLAQFASSTQTMMKNPGTR